MGYGGRSQEKVNVCRLVNVSMSLRDNLYFGGRWKVDLLFNGLIS